MKLDDQFEWDVADETNSPELFAEVYTNELGLSGEFKTAVAHSIREQLQAYERSLVMLGNPMNVASIAEPDFKDFFLPAVTSSTITRNAEMAASFTPFLNVVDEIELAIGTEKERNKRRNKTRQTMRRRPNALPDRDAIRTHRTPAIGFPENDPTTLINGAMNNSTPATGRRAAAVAASSTIASMVASENGGVIMPMPDRPQTNPVPVQKSSKVRGLFKAPAYSTSVLKPRSRIEGAIASTALIKDTPAAPKADVDDEGNPLVAVTGERRVTNKVPSAKRQKELEREEKEREYAKRQHANMVDGVWHCSNCGCPDDIAIGRRKGPLGDKSQCGECGMFNTFSSSVSQIYLCVREILSSLQETT
jgi:SWI/SNF-related matrix-associated actin-dependent regulator of chromatin subfamily B protein 1